MIAEPYASDPVFMERHQAALRRVSMAKHSARVLLTTFGPFRTAADDAAEGFAMRHCAKCTPPPVMHKCPLCDWECDQRWRFKLHLDTNPDWCRKRAAKKAAAWAAKS